MAKLERGNFNPELIRGALRQGDANVVQMFGGGTPAAGDAAIFDAAGNIIAGTSGGGYDLVFAYPGAPPAAYALWIINFTRTVTFAANFGISRGACGTNPAATAIYTVKKNSATVGTITISTAGAFTFATGGAVTFAPGDTLQIVTPAGDLTLSDVTITLSGTR